jgi:hypothetical protein
VSCRSHLSVEKNDGLKYTLASPFDDFLEKHILSSTFYLFLDESEEVCYSAIHNNQLLTQFFIRPFYQKHGQELLDQMIAKHAITSLFVPTCDEQFVSLAVDKDFTITKQAYFFSRYSDENSRG